jgi:hypothetical protein
MESAHGGWGERGIASCENLGLAQRHRFMPPTDRHAAVDWRRSAGKDVRYDAGDGARQLGEGGPYAGRIMERKTEAAWRSREGQAASDRARDRGYVECGSEEVAAVVLGGASGCSARFCMPMPLDWNIGPKCRDLNRTAAGKAPFVPDNVSRVPGEGREDRLRGGISMANPRMVHGELSRTLVAAADFRLARRP